MPPGDLKSATWMSKSATTHSQAGKLSESVKPDSHLVSVRSGAKTVYNDKNLLFTCDIRWWHFESPEDD